MFFVESILHCWMGVPFYIAQLGEVWFACFCDCSGAESFKCVFNLAGLLQKFQVSSIMRYLLRFSKTQEQWKSKAAFTIAFFTTVNHNYNHKQWTLKHWNTKQRSKFTNHQSQTMTFWTCWGKFLFPERSSKMIYGSEKRKRQRRVFLKSAVIGSVL